MVEVFSSYTEILEWFVDTYKPIAEPVQEVIADQVDEIKGFTLGELIVKSQDWILEILF
jgi:hypothetical protein